MVISQGRLWMSAKSRPMVGRALARMVLSSEPMNSGKSTPSTTSRKSRWVSGLAAAPSALASTYLVSGAMPDCSGFSSRRMTATSATVMVAAVAKNTRR